MFDNYGQGLLNTVTRLSSSPTKVKQIGSLSRSPGAGGGDSHMKQTGMLVVSLRGVNFGLWSRLGCSGQSANILSRQGLVQGFVKKHNAFKNYIWIKAFDNYVFIIKTHCMSYLCVFKWSLLGVKIFLSHAQIGLL